MTSIDGPRIGSLFTGVGGLDLAVLDVLGGHVVWHSQYEPPDKKGRPDKHQYAARILAHHWPDVPNLGDITAIDWDQVLKEHGPIDVLIGGFPCTDLSLAGKQAGLTEDTRSGLWLHMARAIHHLNPSLVIIENVRGLLSAPAHSDVEPCPWCLGNGRDEPVLRALGAVLGDLAGLGLNAEWVGLPASAIGAPHERWREFVLAWPADATGQGCAGARLPGCPVEQGAAPADATYLGHERGRDAWIGWARPADSSDATADTDSHSLRQQPVPIPRGSCAPIAAVPGADAPAHTDGRRREGHPERDGRTDNGQPEHQPRLDTLGRGVRREALADTSGSGQRPTERLVQPGQSDPERSAPADPEGERRSEGGPNQRGSKGDLTPPLRSASHWGAYSDAIARWERALGRPAPAPTDDLGRLNPAFVEWMMGLPAGHVTAVPGPPRSAQLKALGNGVVPHQAAAAIRLLFARAGDICPACWTATHPDPKD